MKMKWMGIALLFTLVTGCSEKTVENETPIPADTSHVETVVEQGSEANVTDTP